MHIFRRHLNYANVAATLALVFAMSGGALAAKHYLINSTSQINPKVLKKLKGKAGKTGATGAIGVAGTTGKEGSQGPGGKEGPPGATGPFPKTLPKDDTITGAYGIVGGAGTGTGNDWGISSISFPYPLASPPTVKVVLSGGPSQTGCSGSVSNPTAASGVLCVYEGAHSGVKSGYPDVCTPSGCSVGEGNLEASVTGAEVRVFATSNSVRWYDWGSWAVTG